MTDAALNESAIREQAAEWIVRLDDALDDAQRQAVQAACRAWCAQDERHARIFRQMQQMWQAAAQPAKPKRAGKTAAGLLALLVLCWLLPLQAWLADVRVAPGELHQVTLEDGSRLTLDSGASADIRFDAQTRSVHLHAGRLLADVAKDPQGRSFRVVSRDGTATALGTRYIVDQQAADTTVNVLESSVAVASRARPDQPVVLQAGQTVRYTRAAPGRPEALAATTDAAWTNGQLIFNATPLPEVVAELARHRRGILTLRRADELAELRFTGMLPLQDSDAALRILARSLPVSVEQATPYVVWLAPEETRTQK